MQFDLQLKKELDYYLEQVDKKMSEIASPAAAHEELKNVISCSLNAKGKMLRPALVFMSAGDEAFYNNASYLTDVGAAVELIHTASLIHDDIIDDSQLRRGKPTVQNRFGKSEAVYSGDYMLSRATGYLSKKGLNGDVSILLECVGKMCEGELIQHSNRTNVKADEQEYLKAISGKTATLFETACFLGAKIAKRSQKEMTALFLYGHFLGMMFQLRDDILDWTSTKELCGKPVNEDFISGVFTLPAIYTFSKADYGEKLAAVYNKAVLDRDNSEVTEEARELVKHSGGLSYTISKLNECGEKAKKYLSYIPDDKYKAAMSAMADELCSCQQ